MNSRLLRVLFVISFTFWTFCVHTKAYNIPRNYFVTKSLSIDKYKFQRGRSLFSSSLDNHEICRQQFLSHTIRNLATSWLLINFAEEANAASLAGKNKIGGAEWGVALPPDWKITKKMDSTVRIKGETVLLAQEPSIKAELKINKVPLGRDAAANFSPQDQLLLADFFSGGGKGKSTKEDVVKVMERSLEAQVSSTQSALKGFSMLPESTSLYRDGAGHRYLVYGYEADKCAGPVDFDGFCDYGLVKRKQLAVVTVGLELQARTLQEKRLMEAGEMERREIDVLWICSISAPIKKFNGNVGQLLGDVVTSFELDPISSFELFVK